MKMLNRWFTGLSLTLLATACGPTAAIEGKGIAQGANYPGSYVLKGLECYDSTGTLTAVALTNPSQTSVVLEVAGNTVTETDSDASCTATLVQNAVFEEAANRLSLTQRKSTTSTGASCNFTLSFQKYSGATVSPSSITSTVLHNHAEPDRDFTYSHNSTNGALALATTLKVTGNPSDSCWMIFLKQSLKK